MSDITSTGNGSSVNGTSVPAKKARKAHTSPIVNACNMFRDVLTTVRGEVIAACEDEASAQKMSDLLDLLSSRVAQIAKNGGAVGKKGFVGVFRDPSKHNGETRTYLSMLLSKSLDPALHTDFVAVYGPFRTAEGAKRIAYNPNAELSGLPIVFVESATSEDVSDDETEETPSAE
jgi:hypothetical protein